ncbi:MAG: hypothetical protein AAGG79_03415 [Pseudomonadota bacterium]
MSATVQTPDVFDVWNRTAVGKPPCEMSEGGVICGRWAVTQFKGGPLIPVAVWDDPDHGRMMMRGAAYVPADQQPGVMAFAKKITEEAYQDLFRAFSDPAHRADDPIYRPVTDDTQALLRQAEQLADTNETDQHRAADQLHTARAVEAAIKEIAGRAEQAHKDALAAIRTENKPLVEAAAKAKAQAVKVVEAVMERDSVTSIKGVNGGKAVAVAVSKDVRVADAQALIAHLASDPSDDLLKAILKDARVALRSGNLLPGCEEIEKRSIR